MYWVAILQDYRHCCQTRINYVICSSTTKLICIKKHLALGAKLSAQVLRQSLAILSIVAKPEKLILEDDLLSLEAMQKDMI